MSRQRASSSQNQPPPTPEDLAFRRNYRDISTKDVLSTAILDFELMESMGILDEFNRLTHRVGFREGFWIIPTHCRAYVEATKEFLASLILYEDSEGGHYIEFRIQGQHHTVTLQRMRRWFHFASPRTAHFGYGPDTEDQTATRDSFWYQITSQHLPAVLPDPRVKAIIHPALRVICRSLGFSIFARGESNLRPAHDELKMLATMLRPDDQLERPDLMLLMVRHWLGIQGHGKKGGVLTCGSYVTRICRKLNIDLSEDHECPPPRTIDLRAIRSYGWVTFSRATHTEPARFTWLTETQGSFVLPIATPILFDDDRSWRLEI